MLKIKNEVIVVGGGIGGLATALALGRDGHHVIVLEKSTEFHEIGAGIQLGPNVIKMLEFLDIRKQVENEAFFPNSLSMRDAVSMNKIVKLDLNKNILEKYGYPYLVIYRPDLHRILLEACSKLSNIQLKTNSHVQSFSQNARGVKVKMQCGLEVNGKILIGADGLRSRIREYVVNDGAPRISKHVAYRAVLPRAEIPEDLWENDVVLWAGHKFHLVHYPIRRGELYNIAAIFESNNMNDTEKFNWDQKGDPQELLNYFKGTCPKVLSLLNKVQSWKKWILCDRDPVKNWTKENVTLLGDAAHPMLQYLAQGAGMAIEDAVVLSCAIKQNENNLNHALKLYENARYMRTARTQLTARFYGDIYHADGVMSELRNSLFLSQNESAGFAGLSWLYNGIDLENLFPEKLACAS